MKKQIVITALLLIVSVLATILFACNGGSKGEAPKTPAPQKSDPPETIARDLDLDPTPEEQETLVLFLGDSIGEAVAGPTPVAERENYGYYGIVGNINGFEYYNRAVSISTTADLVALLRRKDDGINMIESLLSSADVIHISIIGNDFLLSNHGNTMIRLATGDYEDIERREAGARANLETIFALIREKNPTATVLLQTLYNPAGPDSPLFPTFARNYLEGMGIGEEDYHDLMAELVDRINDILYTFREEHAYLNEAGERVAPFELLEVHDLFEEVYETDRERWARLFCEDGIHPHNEGHALIASAIQQKLEELGLASDRALKRYKHIRTEQLNRLYAEEADLAEGEKAITSCESIEEVTAVYFDLTKGLTPHYVALPDLEGDTFDTPMTFSVDTLSVSGMNIVNYLDTRLSYVFFGDDGEFEIYLEVNGTIVEMLRSIIAQSGGFNVSALADVGSAVPYFGNVAPGVAYNDLKGLLKYIEEIYGFSLDGIDYDSPEMQKVYDRFAEDYSIVFDDPNVIGDYLAFRAVGKYRLQKVTSPLTGEEYTAIYLNNTVGRSESFLRFTYLEEESEKQLRMTIDVIHLETDLSLMQ